MSTSSPTISPRHLPHPPLEETSSQEASSCCCRCLTTTIKVFVVAFAIITSLVLCLVSCFSLPAIVASGALLLGAGLFAALWRGCCDQTTSKPIPPFPTQDLSVIHPIDYNAYLQEGRRYSF